MKKLSLIVVALLFSTFAFGAVQQVPKDRKIVQINTYNNIAFIIFTPHFNFTQNCNDDSSTLISIRMDDEGGEEMYSAALAAAAQGLNVGFGVSGCNGDKTRAYRVDVLFQ